MGIAAFYGCNFIKKADFSYTDFNSDIYFIKSEFIGDANFEIKYTWSKKFPKFNGTANFRGSTFNGTADFSGRQFCGDVDFRSANYHQPANFIKSQFDKNVDFSESRFDQGADFNSSNFNGDLYLGGTKFLGFLNLTKTKFGILDIYWPDNTKLVCEDGPSYLNLIKNFRNLEQYDVADNIYFQYREWRQNQRTWYEGAKYIDILALYTCGYGVRMEYTIGMSIIMLILFGIVYFVISWSGGINESSSLQKVNESIWFSAIILLSAPKELYPLKNGIYETYAERIKYFTIIERFIGWGLLLLLINTLSRVMIRY